MSKGAKRVLGVAASIAVPFAAPALASAIGLSGALTTAFGSAAMGSAAGGALTGAALGAAKGAVLGEDVRRNALMGGVGGGVSGYLQAPATAPAGGIGANADWSTGLPTTTTPPAGTFADAIRQVPGTIAGQLRDPQVLSDIAVRGGGMLLGSALSGDGLSSAERRLFAQEAENMRGLEQSNQALFDERMRQAQGLAAESQYFDPEYFGLQSARRAQVTGAAARRAGLRGLPEAQRMAESRRFDLDIGRNVGTAYDTGFSSGVQGRINARQAGLTALPTERSYESPSTFTGRAAEALRAQRARQTQEDVGTLFGSLTKREGV